MRTINAGLALVAAGGVAIGTGRAPSAGVMGADFSGGPGVSVRGTFVAPLPGTLKQVHWRKLNSGTGAGNFTVGVTVDGAAVCTLLLACNAPVGGYTEDCPEDTSFAEGQDVHLEVLTDPCAERPQGLASATWLWR